MPVSIVELRVMLLSSVSTVIFDMPEFLVILGIFHATR